MCDNRSGDRDHLSLGIFQDNDITRNPLPRIHVHDRRLIQRIRPVRLISPYPHTSEPKQKETHLIPIFSIQLRPKTQSKFVSSESITGWEAVLEPTVMGMEPRLTRPA